MATPTLLYFEIRQGGELIRKEQSDQAAIKIGSHEKSHLHLDDPEVSRVHAVIEKGEAGIFVIDLGSGRPTFVNGERISKKQLSHGDVLTLGATEVVFMTHDEVAQAEAEHQRRHAIDPRTRLPRDEVLYSRRYLARPAKSDGSVGVAMLWRDHVMAEEIYRPPEPLTMGPTEDSNFRIDHPLLGGKKFELLDATGETPTLRFPKGCEGELYIGTERFSLDEAIAAGRARESGGVGQVAFTQDTRARLVFGDTSLFLHRPTMPVIALPMNRGDFGTLIFFAISFILHALFMAVVQFHPPEIGGLRLDSFGSHDRFVQILLETPVEEPPEEVVIEDLSNDGDDEDIDYAEGNEGRAGDETAPDTGDRMAVEGDNDYAPTELARAQAREEVQDRGVLAAMNRVGGPSSIFGDTPSGSDALMAIGAVQGDGPGASYGQGGLGRYGGGMGGGGSRPGGGLRRVGTLDLEGRSTGSDSGAGRELRQVRDRDTRQPVAVIGTPEIHGQLDRALIQRVIRENHRAITTCYEREAQRDASLEGEVMVGFVIGSDGRVAGANIIHSELRNRAVESCITTRVQQFRFPEPRGGGVVRVEYPFTFSVH